MAQQNTANQPFPSQAGGLVYKVYARSFQPGAPPVLYLFASGYLWNSVSRIFFARNQGLSWTLLQETPSIIDNLLIYYEATATTSQPVLAGETSVTIIDGFGTHRVPIEPWNGTDVAATPASADHVEGAPGTTQLSRGNQISYLAFSRPYQAAPGTEAISLIATCQYPTGMWHIFFTSDEAGYNLMETVPGLANQLITYYVAGFSSGGGQLPAATVSIKDGYGTHAVSVEPLVTGDAPSATAPEPRLSV